MEHVVVARPDCGRRQIYLRQGEVLPARTVTRLNTPDATVCRAVCRARGLKSLIQLRYFERLIAIGTHGREVWLRGLRLASGHGTASHMNDLGSRVLLPPIH